MSLKYIKYLILNSYIIRYYKLWKEKEERTLFFEKQYPSLSKGELLKLIKKSRKAWILYQMGYDDFYRLHCEDKSMDEISEYISLRESRLFCWLVSSVKARRLLNDKYKCYKHFSKYYGRQVELIRSTEIYNELGLNKLKKIIKDNHSYIIKPLNLNCGRGIRIISTLSNIINYIKQVGGDIVIEELIIQDDQLAAFNQSSVNTLRIHTANYSNGDIDVLWPCLRMGRAGSVVDNAGAGGIFSAIDVTTGITTAAIDETRNVWEFHPDSKKNLIGFSIPRWEEAVILAKELARNIPNAGFVAWDLALTKQGWVMVEGNSMPLIIYQIAVRQGIRKEFDSIKNKYKHITRSRD